MCPREEFGDLLIVEEMFFHALEAALEDAGLLKLTRRWQIPPVAVPAIGHSTTVHLPWNYLATFRASTDDHLGDDASGLVDLTCTLTPA